MSTPEPALAPLSAEELADLKAASERISGYPETRYVDVELPAVLWKDILALANALPRLLAQAEREAALRKKVEGQDLLLRAYRLGTRPPERAFTLLRQADKILSQQP